MADHRMMNIERHVNTLLFASLAVLSLSSSYVELTFSGAEPLFEFVLPKVLLWVAGGAILGVLWIEWATILLILLVRRHASRVWGVAIPWAVLNLYFMADTSIGALQDLERFAFEP